MTSARDQNVATRVISLGLLANKLTWYLIGGNEELPAIRVERNVFGQWKIVLKETIDFINSLEAGKTARQTSVPRFLSKAQYLEQIYSAAPIEKKGMKALVEYLEVILKKIDELDNGKKVKKEDQALLIAFSNSIANNCLQNDEFS